MNRCVAIGGLILTLAVTLHVEGRASDEEAAAEKVRQRYARYDEFAIQKVKRDAFPVLHSPKTVRPEEAERAGFVLPRTPVLGVVVNGKARAYPIPKLGFHELVNDSLGGEPIVASW